MARTISLANHFSSDELKVRYQSSSDPVESRRWHLLWLLSQQWYLLDAAASVGVSYSYARQIVHAYDQNSIEAIVNRRRGRLMGSRAIDGAGWHRPTNVEIPEGIHLEFLPPYSPELQPAEHLWQLSDEPLVNRNFQTIEELEETLAARCLTLSAMPEMIRQHTLFHWWKDA